MLFRHRVNNDGVSFPGVLFDALFSTSSIERTVYAFIAGMPRYAILAPWSTVRKDRLSLNSVPVL